MRNLSRKIFEKRLAKHIDELKWLYMELYDNSDMFTELCDEMYYNLCYDNEISGLAISDDPYHRMFQPDNFKDIHLKYRYSYSDDEYYDDKEKPYFRNEDNAKTNMIGEREVQYYEKGEAEEISNLDMVLLRHNGDLFSSCDLSYESMDDMASKQDRAYIGNIYNDTLENILNNFIK